MSRAGQRPVPLLVLGEARRRRLEEHLGAIVRAWHETWASEAGVGPVVALSSEPPVSRVGAITIVAQQEGVVLAWATANTDIVRPLLGGCAPESAMTGTAAPPGALAHGLAEGIVRALCSRLVQAALPAASCVLERRATPGVGTAAGGLAKNVVATITLGRSRPIADLILAPQLVDALIGPRPPAGGRDRMTSRQRAASDQPVRVSAALGEATVSWRELTALCAGDVLVLEQPLESPCTILVEGRGRIAEAQLGTHEGSRAVQITRIAREAVAREALTSRDST